MQGDALKISQWEGWELQGKRRLRFTDDQRSHLARKAKRIRFGRLKEIVGLITPQTLLAWHRKLIAKKYDSSGRRRRVGRPPAKEELRDLVIRVAEENRGWGCTRIRGAMANLGHELGRSTIAEISKQTGLEPAPVRERRGAWTEFLWILEAAAVKSARFPARSPNLNAFAERFVRTIKKECLDRMILIGERSLRRAVGQFCQHYHRERNHQGLENKIIEPESGSAEAGEVNRREQLGGLLRYQHRDAA